MKLSRHFIRASALALALSALGACETGYGYGGSYYEGYYDDYYGPVRHGYWADDGFFYYRSQRDRGYVRDEDRHFRRDPDSGGRHFRMRGDRPQGARPDGPRSGAPRQTPESRINPPH